MNTDMSVQQDFVQNPKFREAFKGVTIYGVAGTNGSGKDSLMDLLVDYGFFMFNTSDCLRQIAQASLKSTARGGANTPMGRVGNAERATYPGGMVELGLLDWFFRVAHLPNDLRPKGLVIGSIRGVNEAKRLKEFGGKLLVTDADPHIRFERLASRRRVDDPMTFEAFHTHEAAEMAVGETDPTKFGMAVVIEMADVRIVNESNDIEAFKAQVLSSLNLA